MIHPAIPSWQPCPPDWTLSECQLLVFRLELAGIPREDDRSLLSNVERSRANQFRFGHHRDRWIRCRSALRRLLAHATHSFPEGVPISYTRQGKPFLDGSNLHFNLSHSQDLALIALARDVEVGVDVELPSAAPDFPAVARRFFTPAEQSHVTSGRPECLPNRFFQVWTRKEALLKSLGQGLLHPPESIDISPTLGSALATISFPTLAAARPFLFIELRPTDASVAALVAAPAAAPVKTINLFHLA